ncbi:sterol desaturase/sphingolipid hydroxylase (fatty acid hydroxylase superfamily) [Tahibacter aquaticus]|uniref:Sterol desaturase/sphingolipid hydroxylase (Fatty acid hydroxylase superfamily) n=1 Tax=Tahibacter aquaticus TaxID=520092 RepID=A0A4R6YID6_9GAMM|nr:sterol desaturase/sphingolipid hydroxylase (fatty acid hydroxylase superfamily) [Tahibacter aquaticus]
MESVAANAPNQSARVLRDLAADRPPVNPIIFAIPVFFALIGIELWLAHRRKANAYNFADAVCSIGLGAMSQVSGIFSKLVMLGIYVLAYEHLRLFELGAGSITVWLGGLLLYDFLYYWHHRLGHEIGVLWAAHVVHHQSEEFNLSTALRQSSSTFLFGWVFYLPMAVLGFPPLVFVVVGLIDLLYQYWIHTEQIGKLGWFDRVFASPSNHRVHHGVNDRYLDKNYGGILILWDRWFGTYADEEDAEPPIYGTRAPLRRYDPIWANLEVYTALARDSWRTRRWRDKLALWWKHPGWQPADLAAAPKIAFDPYNRPKYAPAVARKVQVYVAVQFLLLMLVGADCLARAEALPLAWGLGYVAWAMASLVALCAWLEGSRRAVYLDAARLGAALALLGWSGSWFGGYAQPPLQLAAATLLLASLVAALLLAPALRQSATPASPPAG